MSEPSTLASVDDRLLELRNQINRQHRQYQRSIRQTLADAIAAGQSLAAAKELVRHGQWENWVEENCEFNIRTAERYMRAYHNQNDPRLSDGNDLTLETFLNLLSEAKATAPSPLPTAEAEQPFELQLQPAPEQLPLPDLKSAPYWTRKLAKTGHLVEVK